jgi:putative hemin transport protein
MTTTATTTTTSSTSTPPPPASRDLIARWTAARAANPHLRTRDAAAQLGVSECELLATGLGDTVTVLDGELATLLRQLTGVGRCMGLTRNEHCVIEVDGLYDNVELGPHAGQVIGEGIDLRVFMSRWYVALAVDEPHPKLPRTRRRGVHVFDQAGTAVHKIFLGDETDGGKPEAWAEMIATRRATSQSLPPLRAPEPAPAPKAEADLDTLALQADWDAMQDTHEFFLLLRKHGVTRRQALRLAGPSRARLTTVASLEQLLTSASAAELKTMIFVGNPGCIQIFSGLPRRVVRTGPWFNLMDPGFNLHLREDKVAEAWLVAKPTAAGLVRSLELLDERGETIALVFRKRDDRASAEDPTWVELIGALP